MSITSVVNDTVTSVSVLNAQKPLPPTITNYSVGGVDDTALDPAGGQTVQINGTGFLAGATITFDGSAVAVVTYVNSNQLTFTSPAKSAGTYTIYVVNPDGGTAIYIPGIIYSVLPTWTTGAGTLGSYYETQSISNTVVASGDAPITYSLYSGSLPTGSTLAANGVITGTAPVDSSSTTYSFTIQATDAQLQDSTRSFSLTINTDVVTWVSPANATTYTSAVDSAISNVTLSATDAAGYNVTYSANALPTGISLSGNTISGTPTVIADSSTLLTATAATTNRTATRTINWSITVANDPYFEYNTLLIPGASTTFVDDASTNNFAITINGDTKPNSMNPYTPGYYSNYFDGNGDYLTTPTSANLVLPNNQDWTVESWVYLVGYNTSGNQILFLGNGSGGWTTTFNCDFGINSSTGYTYLEYANGGVNGTAIAGSTVVPLNRWIHLAWVYNGTAKTVTSYVNGIVDINAGSMSTYSPPAATVYATIGRTDPVVPTPTLYFWGYISNARIVKGTAVYTTAFTPPTSPLTAISGTSLLTCQSNRFIDTSTNALTVTVTGNTTVNSFEPFTPNSSYSSYGSGYFDGSGDYLTLPDNTAFDFPGDFTVEAWVYLNTVTGSQGVYSSIDNGADSWVGVTLSFSGTSFLATSYISGDDTITHQTAVSAGRWYHIAIVRNGSSTKSYLNGVQSTSTTSGTYSLTQSGGTIGSQYPGSGPLNGYISNLRVVKGTAVYTTTFTPPTAPLTAISGTSLLTLQNNQSVNNSVFLDNSTNNFLITRNGNTTQGTFSPYGGNWSNYFDGSGDYLTIANNSNLSWTGNVDGSMEAWVYITSSSATGTILSKSDISGSSYPNYAMAIVTGGYLNGYVGQSGFPGTGLGGVTSATAIPLNTWAHVLFTRKYVGGASQNEYRIFVNGVLRGFTTNESPSDSRAGNCVVGGISGGGSYFSGYISNLRFFNNSIPVAYQTSSQTVGTTIFTPSTTPLIMETGTQLLTCQSNRLIDNSINNFTITKSGDTSVQRFSPFNPSSVTPTSYSGCFDGNGDYLNTPSNAVFGFGTGDFTIEAWFYFTGTISTYQRPWWFGDDNDNVEINGSVLRVGGASQGTLITGGTTIVANTWYHIALTRASGSYKLWLNGSQQGSTASNSYNSSARTFTAMATSGGANPSTGYVSNLRIVKGTAVYTTTFTPSTTPLTAISGTSLLTCQSSTFIDNSTNNLTLTAAGNSQPSIQNPFGYTSTTTNGYTTSTIGGSGYFDGSGDYLLTPSSTNLVIGTGNFAVEAWIYPTAYDNYNGYVSTVTSASTPTGFSMSYDQGWIGSTSIDVTYAWASLLTLNAWNHIAITREGTTVRWFVNGILRNTATSSLNLTSSTATIGGRYYNGTYLAKGYISDARIVSGSAVYTSSFVPPSAPLTAITNTALLTNMTNAGIYDASMINDIESVGDAKLSTAVTKFGGSSMYFDGTGDYLSSNPIGSGDLGTGDFTIEYWMNASAAGTYSGPVGTQEVAGFATAGMWRCLNRFNSANGIYFAYSTGSTFVDITFTTTNYNDGNWYHIAYVKSGTSLKAYVNGTQVGTAATVTQSLTSGKRLTIGYNPQDNAYYTGYIDDLRITKGYARYTSNFTPPTTPFPVY